MVQRTVGMWLTGSEEVTACDDKTEFTCSNSKCIPLTSVSNSFNDCGDNSDEGEANVSSIISFSYFWPYFDHAQLFITRCYCSDLLYPLSRALLQRLTIGSPAGRFPASNFSEVVINGNVETSGSLYENIDIFLRTLGLGYTLQE